MFCYGLDETVEDLIFEEPQRRPRWIRERSNYFDELDEVDFVSRFRLSKTSALNVLDEIENQLEFPSDKNDSVSPMNQLLVTLRYYATNCHLQELADFGGFSAPTAHRIVHRVSAAIARLMPRYITFPTTMQEMQATQQKFYSVASFPRVLGAIDCSHVRITSPGSEIAEPFRNRKGYFSINVQAITNECMEFSNIVARWQGSAHDSTIFNNSRICAKFENGEYEGLLLGDSGYPCRDYLLTPIEVPRNQEEQVYNASHIRTRNVVERTFGVWKRRFPVLALGMRLNIQTTFAIIVATAVLHNILRRAGEELPPDDPDVIHLPWEELMQQGDMGEREANHQNGRFIVRQEIINYYRNLIN